MLGGRILRAVAAAVAAGVPVTALAGVDLPGTQPGELTVDLRGPEACSACHGSFAEHAPSEVWAGTMMANAARDPLFLAALTIANQDDPDAGDLCLRCHTPRGWLFGRSEPHDGSALEPGDLEGVTCDFCHRLVEGPEGERLIGNGQFFVADDQARRGPIMDPLAPHETVYSTYFESSELCGLCHDVSNPLKGGFAIERTYTEWLSSAFADEGTSCQSCHFPAREGLACGAPGMPERTVHTHELAGGNAWIPLVLAGEYPELERGPAYQRAANNAVKMLRSAAEVTVSASGAARDGELAFTVRVENRTGHKLPTGYPEGRRSWLEIRVHDGAGRLLLHSGAYDPATGHRAADPQLRTYEVRMAAGGQEGFHFVLQDQLLQDNRIPPRGFVPAPDTMPVGRAYPVQADGALAHWDDAPYRVSIPADAPGTVIVVMATLWYQTTSHEYVEFLRDENHTDDRGQHMYDLWERYGRSPPVDMASDVVILDIGEAPTPAPDSCSSTRAPLGTGALLLLVILAAVHTRKKGSKRS